jgi:hypothetical protein
LNLLGHRPGAEDAVEAFLLLLQEHEDKEDGLLRETVATIESEQLIEDVDADLAGDGLIPVVGRTAAGLPAFWNTDPGPLTELSSLFERKRGGSKIAREGKLESPDDMASTAARCHLVQLSKPIQVDDFSIAEFLHSPEIRRNYDAPFALRVDGASMSPKYEDGDLVVLSPSIPAESGKAGVIQLRNQIGVTCKLYRRDPDQTWLIPINERFESMQYSESDILWTLKVLCRIRF